LFIVKKSVNMTIFKTNLNGQKPPKPEEQQQTTAPLPLKKDAEDGVTYSHRYSSTRAPKKLLKVCVAAAALTLIMIAICGGIYLYRMHKAHKFEGWCGVKYIDDEVYPEKSGKRGFFREHINVDGNYEKIQVPKFSENNPAVILHDFGLNFTAIVDEDNSRCFVMPLDRKNITPPKGIVDLMTKMLSGYYLPDARVVRHRFKVIEPPVSNVNRLGSFIAGYCHLYDTYMLKKIIMERKSGHHHTEHHHKHHDHHERNRRGANQNYIVAEVADDGKALLKYDIEH